MVVVCSDAWPSTFYTTSTGTSFATDWVPNV